MYEMTYMAHVWAFVVYIYVCVYDAYKLCDDLREIIIMGAIIE